MSPVTDKLAAQIVNQSSIASKVPAMSYGLLTTPIPNAPAELQNLKPSVMELTQITEPRATKAKGISIESLFAENLKSFINSNNPQKKLFKNSSEGGETSSGSATSDYSSSSRSDNGLDVSLISFDDCDCQDMQKSDEQKNEPKECLDRAIILAVAAKTKVAPAAVACADDFASGSSERLSIDEGITASLTLELQPIAAPDTTLEFVTKIAAASKVSNPGPLNVSSERNASSARSHAPLGHLQNKSSAVHSSKNTQVQSQVHVIRKINLPRNINMPEDPRFKGYCHRWLDRLDFCTKEMCPFKHANPPELVKEYGLVTIGVDDKGKSVRDVDLGSRQGCLERSLSLGPYRRHAKIGWNSGNVVLRRNVGISTI